MVMGISYPFYVTLLNVSLIHVMFQVISLSGTCCGEKIITSSVAQ